MQKRKSFREIAKDCNVSPATVSRIANGVGSFKEETRSLVVSHLIINGYEIDSENETKATALKNIALIVTDLNNEIFCSIIAHLRSYLLERDCLLSIYVENQDQGYLTEQLLKSQVQGIIFLSRPLEALAFESPVPAVQVLSESNQITYRGKRYTVNSDDFVGGQLAAQEFLRGGCRRPLILNNRHTHSSVSPRIKGFLYEFENAGISTEDIMIYEGDRNKSSFNSANDAVSYFWTRGDEFDSIFACSDWRAYGALIALKNKNIPVPERIKVIGYEGILISRYSQLPLTTIQQNPDMLATAAADKLLSLMKGEEPEQETYIPVQIQTGLTV